MVGPTVGLGPLYRKSSFDYYEYSEAIFYQPALLPMTGTVLEYQVQSLTGTGPGTRYQVGPLLVGSTRFWYGLAAWPY